MKSRSWGWIALVCIALIAGLLVGRSGSTKVASQAAAAPTTSRARNRVAPTVGVGHPAYKDLPVILQLTASIASLHEAVVLPQSLGIPAGGDGPRRRSGHRGPGGRRGEPRPAPGAGGAGAGLAGGRDDRGRDVAGVRRGRPGAGGECGRGGAQRRGEPGQRPRGAHQGAGHPRGRPGDVRSHGDTGPAGRGRAAGARRREGHGHLGSSGRRPGAGADQRRGSPGDPGARAGRRAAAAGRGRAVAGAHAVGAGWLGGRRAAEPADRTPERHDRRAVYRDRGRAHPGPRGVRDSRDVDAHRHRSPT